MIELDESLPLSILQSARDGIVVTDVSSPKNEIVYANQRFVKMLGYSQQELQGLGTRFLLGSKTRPTAAHTFRRAINEKIPCLLTVSATKKDGSEIWIEISGSPVNGGLTGDNYYVGICRDVTTRMDAIESLISAEISVEVPEKQEETGSIDPITSLYNRSYFEEYAEREWTAMLRQHLPISIFMMGVKNIGMLPEEQDGALSQILICEMVADKLRQVFRRGTDLVARFDQNRFVGICAGMGWEEAEKMAESAASQINRSLNNLQIDKVKLSGRVGVATSIPEQHSQLEEITSAAGKALELAVSEEEGGSFYKVIDIRGNL